MPVLAQLDIYHSRSIAPTRRVSLGDSRLPVEPPPGFGGLLLGGVVAAHIGEVDPDLHPDLLRLTAELEDGRRIPQPRLRYRFQGDRVGLIRSRHRLLGDGEELSFDFEDRGTAAQQVLGAVYAAGQLDPELRHPVMNVLRRAIGWSGPVGPDLIATLSGAGHHSFSMAAYENPRLWALSLFGYEPPDLAQPTEVAPTDVVRRFRVLLREAHPDHGGESELAAERIAELTEARRILLGR